MRLLKGSKKQGLPRCTDSGLELSSNLKPEKSSIQARAENYSPFPKTWVRIFRSSSTSVSSASQSSGAPLWHLDFGNETKIDSFLLAFEVRHLTNILRCTLGDASNVRHSGSADPS